jgi:hypothetical protein
MGRRGVEIQGDLQRTLTVAAQVQQEQTIHGLREMIINNEHLSPADRGTLMDAIEQVGRQAVPNLQDQQGPPPIFQVMLPNAEPQRRVPTAAEIQAVQEAHVDQVPLPWEVGSFIAMKSAIPFTVIGVADNAIMIVAGDFIDNKLQVYGFTTMAAAAVGNTLSDAIGVKLGDDVERRAEENPTMREMLRNALEMGEQPQYSQSNARWDAFGKVGGIVVGCAIGATPLLLLPDKSDAATPPTAPGAAAPEDRAVLAAEMTDDHGRRIGTVLFDLTAVMRTAMQRGISTTEWGDVQMMQLSN